ncbi:hypothetical protein JCM3774_005936 [Rhodotorula dairenensis]
MVTPKRPLPLSAADYPQPAPLEALSLSSSSSPRPSKRSKPNHPHQHRSRQLQNGTAAHVNTTESRSWRRPIDDLLGLFRSVAFPRQPVAPAASSVPTPPLALEDDTFRVSDPQDRDKSPDEIAREINALEARSKLLLRQHSHRVIDARQSNSTIPARSLILQLIPQRIKHLRQIQSEQLDMPRRLNAGTGSSQLHPRAAGQHANGTYVRRQPMGKKEVRAPNHPLPTAVGPAARAGPELTVAQPRSAPAPDPAPALSLPVLAHPSPLLPQPTHSPAPDGGPSDSPPAPRRRRRRRRQRQSQPQPQPQPQQTPSPSPLPVEPSQQLRPPWAPTSHPPPAADTFTSASMNRQPLIRTEQARSKVKARDISDIECLASAQSNPSAHDMTGPTTSWTSLFSENDGEDDDAHAPEADEEERDVLKERLDAVLIEDEDPDRRSTGLGQSRNRSHRRGSQQRSVFASDLIAPSPNDLGAGIGLTVRPPYSPNYVKGTSSFAGYGVPHARRSLYGKAPLVADGGDKVGTLSTAFKNVLDLARKSEMEVTPEWHEKWEALKAKRKEDELEAERRVLAESKVKRVRKRRFPAKLSKEQAMIVQDIFSNRSYETSIKGAAAAFRDMNRLNGQEWLNDELINYYGVMINNRSDAADAREKANEPDPRGFGEERVLKAFCFNTNFFTMYRQSGFAKVKRWTRRFDTFAKDIIIVPVNHKNMHWCCAAINIREKRFEYYDSLGSPRDFVYKSLREWLAEEHKSRKGTEIDLSDWEDYWDPNVPRQGNANDCGVFTCMFMEALSRDCAGFDFEQKNMAYLRRRIALEIDKGELLSLEEFA